MTVVFLDGGMGSALTDMGYDIDSDPLWSAKVLSEDPNGIIEAHKLDVII